MRKARIVSAAIFVTACGGAPTPKPVTVAPAPVPTAQVEAPPAKVDAPSDLVAWMHVEDPAKLAELVQRVSGPASADASCAKGDPRACLELADPSRPVDVGVVLQNDQDGEATAFSVRGLESFRVLAAKDFDVKDVARGRLELVPKKTTGDKKPTTVVCDVSQAAASAHRVVCGDERGVARLAPWLLGSPEPASREGLARIEIYRAPVVAAADAKWTDDGASHREARALAHDFDGATITLAAGDGADPRVDLGLDVRMRESHSTWTQALLTPAGTSAAPDTFARLDPDSTATLRIPGGGAVAALLERVGAFDDLAKLDPAKTKPVLDEVRAVLARPIACGYVLDLDRGRAALAAARRAPEKDRDKANHALDQALSGHAMCAVAEPTKSAEKLARTLASLAPKGPTADRYAVRSATSLGLPAGSFLVETTHPTQHAAKGAKPNAPRVETTLAIPDGDTTWVVFAEDASDARDAAQLAKRVLARPKSAAAAAKPGTIASGWMSTLLGAFFWDLAMHSYDAIDKTLATAASADRLEVALTNAPAGSGGTISLRLSANARALPALGARASALALPVGLFLAVLLADTKSAAP